MLKTIEEISEVEKDAGVVVNGIDNANLLSVDSTESVQSKPDKEKVSDEDIDIKTETEIEIEIENKEEKTEKKEKVEKSETGKKDDKEEKVETKIEKESNKVDDGVEPTDSKNVKKRIGKLTKRMRTAERDSEFSKRRIAELKEEVKALKTKVPDDSKPNKADYDDEDEYSEALMDWKVDKKFNDAEIDKVNKAKETVEKDEVDESYSDLDDALEAGREKYDNFDKLVMHDDLIISENVTQILLDTEIPEDIMYYLAENPDESEELSKLDPIRIAKEIGKLEVKLSKVEKKEAEPEPEKKMKKQSKAPAPIESVKTDGVVDKDPEDMSPKEYKAYREKQSQ